MKDIDLNKEFDVKKKIINIVFEGIDKSGKSTLSKELYWYLYKNLNKDKYKVSLYNHPNSNICKEEREFILNNLLDPMDEAEIFIKCKNKLIDHISSSIETDKININIIDRWIHSTYVYQNLNMYKKTKLFINEEINNIIKNDKYYNTFNIDFLFYIDLKYTTFKNRSINKIDERESLISDKAIFSICRKLYYKTINNTDLHDNCVIIDSRLNSISYKLAIIVNSLIKKIKEVDNIDKRI